MHVWLSGRKWGTEGGYSNHCEGAQEGKSWFCLWCSKHASFWRYSASGLWALFPWISSKAPALETISMLRRHSCLVNLRCFICNVSLYSPRWSTCGQQDHRYLLQWFHPQRHPHAVIIPPFGKLIASVFLKGHNF